MVRCLHCLAVTRGQGCDVVVDHSGITFLLWVVCLFATEHGVAIIDDTRGIPGASRGQGAGTVVARI